MCLSVFFISAGKHMRWIPQERKKDGRRVMQSFFTRLIKNPNRKKGSAPRTHKEREELAARRRAARRDPDSRLNIAMPYIWICLSIFVGFCLYTGQGGMLGDGFRWLFLGLFSYIAYALPFFMILLGIFWRRGIANGTVYRHMALFFVATLMLLSLLYTLSLPADVLHGITPKEEVLLDLGSYFDFSAPRAAGGGAFGALIGWILYRLIGPVGSILLASLAVLLYGIFAFGFSPDAIFRSFFASLREKRQKKQEAEEPLPVMESEAFPERDSRPQSSGNASGGSRLTLFGRKKKPDIPAFPETGTAPAREPEPSDRSAQAYRDEPKRALKNEEPLPANDRQSRGESPLLDFSSPLQQNRPESNRKHRRFAELFDETAQSPAKSGRTRKDDPSLFSSTPLDYTSPEDARAYKVKRVREKLRNREGVLSYSASDLMARQHIAPILGEKAAAEPDRNGNGASVDAGHAAPSPSPAEIPVADREEASAPFRNVEDFRRVTVSEPVCVRRAPQKPFAADTRISPPSSASGQETSPASPADTQTETPVRMTESVMERASSAFAAPGGHTMAASVPEKPKKPAIRYEYPPVSLLHVPNLEAEGDVQEEIRKNSETLVQVMESFGIPIRITGYSRGPRITRYEFIQKEGIRVGRIASFEDDITQKLSTQGVRIEAPIPNKSSIGVEVPNRQSSLVRIRSLLDTDAFRNASSKTTVAIGCDIAGTPVFFDIAKAPHMLIAGATGMGKSVCINSLLISLLYKATPDEVKLILVDPKKVEFNIYAKIPHLLVPVVTDPTKAAGALNWAVAEMDRRYDLIEAAGVRDINSYNKSCDTEGQEKLSKIVIVIDELNELLMMSSRKTVEAAICRIAQKARAAGIHLIIGTQRPSVKVITGDIKANIPARIAFRVNQQVDSRTILDMAGAERLLPHGDMLFSPAGIPIRVQGAFVEDDEVKQVTSFLRDRFGEAVFDDNILAGIEKEAAKCAQHNGDDEDEDDEDINFEGIMSDPKFKKALSVAFASGSISTSMLQRRIGVGFGRGSRIIDAMCDMGIVGESLGGARGREVIMTRAEYEEKFGDFVDD